jgi:predicted site-specific integrase-resolvase
MNDILKTLDERTTAMTVQECATLLGADVTTLYRHARSGRFPTFLVVGMLRVNPSELAAHLRASSNCQVQSIDGRRKKAA